MEFWNSRIAERKKTKSESFKVVEFKHLNIWSKSLKVGRFRIWKKKKKKELKVLECKCYMYRYKKRLKINENQKEK